MTGTEHDWVKAKLLLEALYGETNVDWVSLGRIDYQFVAAARQFDQPRPSTHELQQSTLRMIGELVTEGLVTLGDPTPTETEPHHFDPWNLPLDQAMAKIEHAYIDNHDDGTWRDIVWLELTDKGHTRAHELQPDWTPVIEHDWVKEQLLVGGLRDRNALGWIHSMFMAAAEESGKPRPPARELQQSTLAMIRELVTDDLCILGNLKWGVVKGRGSAVVGFEPWNLPLDQAMNEVEHAYFDNYDDLASWQTMVWLDLTDNGRTLAHQIENSW